MSNYRFRCECGCEFDEPEVVKESRGEFWGVPCWEDMYYCPACHDSCFEEIEDEDEEEDDEYGEED